MSSTLSQPTLNALLHKVAPKPAKAKVHTAAQNLDRIASDAAKVHASAHQKIARQQFYADIGRAVETAEFLSRLTGQQFAEAIGVDASLLSKWKRNVVPAQIDRILMSSMRGYFLQAMAEATPGCDVTTTITMRRPA